MNTVMRLDLVMKRYTTLAPMITARSGHATAVLDGKLFVMGGYNSGYLSSVECLDLSVPNSQWTTVAPMTSSRYSKGAVVTGGRIYVAGGSRSSIECFDPSDGLVGRWAAVSGTSQFTAGAKISAY